MHSMALIITLILGTALFTLAASHRQFTIDFTTHNPLNSSVPLHHPAVVTRNGTSGQIVLAAGTPTCRGTPAYFDTNGRSVDAKGFLYGALDFDFTSCSNTTEAGVYGAFAGDVGEVYGLSYAVSLLKGQEDFSWLHTGDTLGYRMAAASNGLFACNRTINGETRMVLSWGAYREIPFFEPPEGCDWTMVTTKDINGTMATDCPF